MTAPGIGPSVPRPRHVCWVLALAACALAACGPAGSLAHTLTPEQATVSVDARHTATAAQAGPGAGAAVSPTVALPTAHPATAASPAPSPTRPPVPQTAGSSTPRPAPASVTAPTRPSAVATAHPVPDSSLPPPVRAALRDAQRRATPGDAVLIVSVVAVEWPDASLGCPKPGMMYAQVVTSGYRVKVAVGGTVLDYHTDVSTRAELCN